MVTKAFLQRSLALWQRREQFRKERHTAAQRELDDARRRDIHPRQQLVDRRDHWSKLLTEARRMVERREKQLLAAAPALWHPAAVRVPFEDAGPFVTGAPKILHHTTEGSTIAGAEGAYRANRSAPHFTFDHDRGVLHQHIPINLAARALRHPAGVPETNRAHVIQIEHVGLASQSSGWSAAAYQRVADLCRWIEANADVDRRCGVKFAPGALRLQGQAWVGYRGHCGHMHAPGNDHVDPGSLRIQLIV